MLLFYHKKMLETFADGIYWDNFFLQPNYAPAAAGGPGYVDDDGRPRAGVNLMGFRNLVKRTATMMHVMGKRPLTYIHMTNVNIVPMLSFGTLNLDWEWRDQGEMGSKDLQDRMDLDLILTQSLGLQAGNVSVGITGNILRGGKGVSREWLHRTAMAVCFPHEIKNYQGTKDVTFVQDQLAKFGYGQADCKVYRYWEPGQPVTLEGANARALVLSRGPKAMLAIGDYGRGTKGPDAPAPAAPTLEEYDAAQRGIGPRPSDTKTTVPAPTRPVEIHTLTIKLDLKALGLTEATRARDVERAAVDAAAGELKRIAPGVFELKIRKHDFALIEVE